MTSTAKESLNLDAFELTQLLAILSQIAFDENTKSPAYKDRKTCAALAKNALKLVAPHLLVEAAAPAVPADQDPEFILGTAGHYTIYTDGGCKGNPGPAGCGVVILQDGVIVLQEGSFIGHRTNQIAELQAAIIGLSKVPFGSTVELVSDSQYTLKGLTEWRHGWIARGWKNSKGEAVANQGLWRELFKLADDRKVTTRWVKGHSGDPMNELCDQLADRAIAALSIVR